MVPHHAPRYDSLGGREDSPRSFIAVKSPMLSFSSFSPGTGRAKKGAERGDNEEGSVVMARRHRCPKLEPRNYSVVGQPLTARGESRWARLEKRVRPTINQNSLFLSLSSCSLPKSRDEDSIMLPAARRRISLNIRCWRVKYSILGSTCSCSASERYSRAIDTNDQFVRSSGYPQACLREASFLFGEEISRFADTSRSTRDIHGMRNALFVVRLFSSCIRPHLVGMRYW